MQLEWVPGSFQVIRHVRPKLSCTGSDAIVVTAKFCDHLPLYRQSEIYGREGVELDRSALAKWVGDANQLLQPLVEVLRRYVMAADKLHGDDTPVPVLAPEL